MAGNPLLTELWTDADVYVAPLETTLPASIDAPFAAAWEAVGLLDGDAGFGEQREEQKDDFFAWGGLLFRQSRRQFKLTRTFTAYEWNDTTRDLLWPGSTETTLVVPKPVRQLIAFETREGDKIKRLITANYAEIELNGDISEAESAPTTYEFIATIYPTGAGALFTIQDGVVTPD